MAATALTFIEKRAFSNGLSLAQVTAFGLPQAPTEPAAVPPLAALLAAALTFPRFMLFSRLSRARRQMLSSCVLRLRPVVAASLPALGAVPLLAVPAAAKPAKLTGVQAWTSGAQTYIRVRPSQNVPIVAKVAKHTPLYVWGKYNGWYRVQTHDDIFGWVHYELLNSPALGKVQELSHQTAKTASKRSADTTMWGSPQQLKTYYQKHNASGALKGLREMGVPVKVTIGNPPKTRAVSAKPRRVAPQKQVAAPKPRVSAPKVTYVAAPKPRVSAPKKTAVSASKPRVYSAPPARPVAQRPVVTVVTTPRVTAPVMQKPVTLLPPAPPRKVASPKAAPKKASSRQIVRAKNRQQLRDKMGMNAVTPPAPIGDITPVSPEDLMKARRAYLEARRQRLEKAKEPAAPQSSASDEALGGPKVTPSSFETGDGSAGLDANGWAPFNAAGWSAARAPRAGFAVWNREFAPGFRLVTEEVEAQKLGDDGLDDAELAKWESLPTLNSIQPVTRANAKKKPKAAATAPNRGGSPRDRYKTPNGDFRQNMANQALSYRGRPYVFGASSPGRGFDCSGLIYFLLRQRGYNPPRTAAGYKNYGTAVARGQWKAGDLLLFANTYKHGISHIGIYLGDNKFVHAASTRQGVRVDSMNTKYYAAKYYSARRVPGK